MSNSPSKLSSSRLGDKLWRLAVIMLPYWWLIIFFLVPFAIVFKISFADPVVAQPPFTDFFNTTDNSKGWLLATLDNYRFLTEDNLYWVSYLKSIKVALISTLLCLLLGYPMAYGIARSTPVMRNILLMLIILPFWTSFLLRVYAWMGMLGKNGLINNLLLSLELIETPLEMLYSDAAVYVGIVYTYIPFMILPLYATLEKLDLNLHDAAADLGAKPWQVFVDITLPLSMPGIIAGSLLVFIPALGEYVIPALLGGIDSLMIGRTLYDEFFVNRDWPLASAVATVLLLIIVIPIVLFQRSQQEEMQ
ncbi:ABC transporter permease subunit [Oceanicoccus sagamiensis]|uniref:Putrescine ABC transporter permease PotH n=1 Tax=Oceanicoccus sagamiensis TaxID=716816 RepID=A0A1X9NKI8_9GAMM|nr:ABC transporter permease subunit [Oceanicoccus sagamiensis]ARN75959.1 putrescine ABC transporter permease PotH [Oceanicoccus sagamiensis]